MDIHVHLARNNLSHLVEQTDAVDTGYLDCCVKEECAPHRPLCVEDAVAETGLQLGCHRTVALVYLDLLLAVDVSQDVVAGDRVTTIHKLILVDVVVGYVDWFLAVELVGHSEQLFLCSLSLSGDILFLVAEERHILSPSLSGCFLLIASMYLVDVLFG